MSLKFLVLCVLMKEHVFSSYCSPEVQYAYSYLHDTCFSNRSQTTAVSFIMSGCLMWLSVTHLK